MSESVCEWRICSLYSRRKGHRASVCRVSPAPPFFLGSRNHPEFSSGEDNRLRGQGVLLETGQSCVDRVGR